MRKKTPAMVLPVLVNVSANPGWELVVHDTYGPLLVHPEGWTTRWDPGAVALNLAHVLRNSSPVPSLGHLVPYRVTRLRSMAT